MSPAPCARSATVVAIAVLGCLTRVSAAEAQAPWDARLDIAGYPSPYLSDWESNPSIATLTITNPTGADQNVLLVYRVTDQHGRQLATGRSDPQLIPRGAPTVITDVVNISGSSQHDQALEDQMRRTGRLPEGDNTACVAVTDPGGFVLAEDCATFSVVYPDPPYLIGPIDEGSLSSGNPVFQWTPLQVPPAFRLTYVVRVSEVLAGQTPLQALVANIPVFATTVAGTNLEYPISAAPLVEGKTYAWQVQALDQNGYAASSNEGRSEVWTFAPGQGGGGGPVGAPAAMTLEVYNLASNAAGAPSAPDSLAFLAICSTWSTGSIGSDRVVLGMASPVAFPAALSMRASLVRYNVPNTTSRVWALRGTAGKYMLMAYGDCDGPAGQVPWPKWLAIRTIAGAVSARWLVTADTAATGAISTDSTIADTSTARGLEFGIVIVSLLEQTVGAPAGFTVVNEFLQNNEIEVKPGINAFGIVQLAQRSWWGFFQWLGYDQKEITLQGFVGLTNSVSVGFGYETEAGAGADVSLEQEFMRLRAALPTRQPPGFLRHVFKQTHLEFELVVQDSMQAGVSRQEGRGAGFQLDVLLNVNEVMELSDAANQALHLDPGAAFVGTVGLDLGFEAKGGTGLGAPDLKFVTRLELDGSWPLGGGWTIGRPRLELDYTLTGDDKGDWLISGALNLGHGALDDLGVLGITYARESPDSSINTDSDDFMRRELQGKLDMQRTLMDGRQAQLRRCAGATECASRQQAVDDAQSNLDRTRRQLENFNTRAARPAVAPTRPVAPARQTKWTFRMSLGNVSLADLLSLLGNLAGTLISSPAP